MSRIIKSLQNFGDVNFDGSLSYGDALVPPAIEGNTDNYDPTGWQESILIDISSDGNYYITGWMAPDPDGTRVINVFNVGTNNIILKDNNSGSDPANRFLLGSDKTMQSDEGLQLIYDNNVDRWRSPGINI